MTEIHQTSLLQSHRSNDRVFIGLAWVWIAYAVLNILTWRHSASSFSVDLMPLLAGALIIPFGWHAGRLDREIRDAVDALDDGAALVFGSEEGKSHDEFFADLHATIRRWSWRLAVGVVFVILVAMVSQVREELQEGSTTAVDVGIFLALTSVMSGAGAIIELLLGRLVGFGRLSRIMEAHEVALAGISTPGARSALRALQSYFVFAFLTTFTMCLWFDGWMLIWAAGLDPGDYKVRWMDLFTVMWVISSTLYLVIVVWPSGKFQTMIDDTIGGPDARLALNSQLVDARADLEEIVKGGKALDRTARRHKVELEAFIAHLEQQRVGSPLYCRECSTAFLS